MEIGGVLKEQRQWEEAAADYLNRGAILTPSAHVTKQLSRPMANQSFRLFSNPAASNLTL